MILYRIVTTQHLDTDTVYQLYRTSLLLFTSTSREYIFQFCLAAVNDPKGPSALLTSQ